MRLLSKNWPRIIILIFFCVAIVQPADAQKKRPPKQKKEKRKATSKEDSNRTKKVKALGASRDRHEKIQDKKTRKRMKQTRKKSMIHAGEKKLPFYKRWFRRKR